MSAETIKKAAELFKKKKVHEALKQFELCKDSGENVVRMKAYYGMACCYSHLQDVYNAKECFQNVISLDPKSAEAAVARTFNEDAKKWIDGEINLFSITTEIKRAESGKMCSSHEKEEAVYVCPSCSKNTCLQCTFPYASQYYCMECGRQKEQQYRAASPLRDIQKKKKDEESEELKKEKEHARVRVSWHLWLLLAFLCASLFYRFELRDARAKHAGLEIINKKLEVLAIRKSTAFGADTKNDGIDYLVKGGIKNSGQNAVSHIWIQMKLYDAFGQKVTGKNVLLGDYAGGRNTVLKPSSTLSFKVPLKGIKKTVSTLKARISSFESR